MTDEDVVGLVMAGWSLTHGFATLALTANLTDPLTTDTAALTTQVTQGIITLANSQKNRRHVVRVTGKSPTSSRTPRSVSIG